MLWVYGHYKYFCSYTAGIDFSLDCMQIWYGCSLGISGDLINFWDESIKNKMAAAAI